jgi:hypothetical protein
MRCRRERAVVPAAAALPQREAWILIAGGKRGQRVRAGSNSSRATGTPSICVASLSAQAWELKRSPLLHGRRASDYELDHIIPIGLGGAVLNRSNLQLQRRSGACNAHMKDELERQLSITVCAGDATLIRASTRARADRLPIPVFPQFLKPCRAGPQRRP